MLLEKSMLTFVKNIINTNIILYTYTFSLFDFD